MKTLGAEDATYTVDGDERHVYACTVPGLQSGFSDIGNRVPCYFQDPEDVYRPYVLPSFQFRRNDLSPAWDRHSWYMWVAREPSKDAQEITLPDGSVGYTKYDNQWRANQLDISYDFMIMARRRQESLLMIQYALKRFEPPWFTFKVVDSNGDVRDYDAEATAISNTSEIADIADRTVGYTMSFTVRAEVDLHVDVESVAMSDMRITYNRYESSEISDIND